MLLHKLFVTSAFVTTTLASLLVARNNPCSPCPAAECPLARAVYPELPRAYSGVSVPDNNVPVAVTLGIGNFTYTCTSNHYVPSIPRAALYDISPLLLRSHNQTRTTSSLLHSAFLSGDPPCGQAVDDYIGFHSGVSYTNTTPVVTVGPCTGKEETDEAPRTLSLPFFVLYRPSPSCPSEGTGEKKGTFVSTGRFPAPRAREGSSAMSTGSSLR